MAAGYEIKPIGVVESPLVDRSEAPCQGAGIVDVKPVLDATR